ncbi:hypothetical protein C8J57DRAFT_1224155 [Mycena rebaudengoi]|nr:hypothetical protein C8J57DRAFT_1224155 [Mycena rebaudengoi]
MPPLTRQQTRESLRSWWSDSNPNLRGPTINLHAAAKPLMKLLYNRQALEFIRTIDDTPLSAKDAEIYGSYLLCEYVSGSTKSAILKEILQRTHSEPEALTIQSNMFHDIVKLFEVPATMDAVLMILVALAQREGTAAATRKTVIRHRSLKEYFTSGASVEAKLLDHIADMINDSSTTEWRYSRIFQIVSTLALHEPTAVTVVEANALNSVEKLLRSRPIRLYKHIFPLLENLASHESTAMAVVHTIPFDLLGSLWHKSFEDTAPIDVLASRLEVLATTKLLGSPCKAIAEATCGSLVALVCDSNIPPVVDGVLWLLSRVPGGNFSLILSNLALHESSAVAIMEANVLNSVEKLLRSRPTDLYQHIFSMLKSLTSYESTAMAVVRMLPLLLGTLWHKSVDDTAPIDPLAEWWEGPATTLLDAPRKSTAEATCGSLVALVCDSATPHVVDGALWLLSRVPHLKFSPVTTGVSVEARLFTRIADMLRVKAQSTAKLRYLAIFQILSHLALHESSAVAIVETNILKSIENLPRSSRIHLHWDIYQILRNLVSHESTATAVLDMCRLLATLWRESLETDTYSTIQAIGTLTRIASFPGGAEGVVTAKLLNDVLNGLHSTTYSVRLYTCKLLRELVRHESVVQAVVAAVPREDIVALSSDRHFFVRECAETLEIFDATLERIDGNSPAQWA